MALVLHGWPTFERYFLVSLFSSVQFQVFIFRLNFFVFQHEKLYEVKNVIALWFFM